MPKSSVLSLAPSLGLKPHKHEATLRIRNSTLSLVGFCLLTYLLPLPDPITSLRVVLSKRPAGNIWLSICAVELTLVALLGLNILQASIALRFPRKPHPVPASPIKGLALSPPSQPKRRKGLSPNTSPQPQKSFSPFASSSFTTSTTYAPSPLSTPSRVLTYTAPSPAASLSSMGASSPSPMVAGYRGRHVGSGVGRALDGSLLQRLAAEDSDSD
jgi:hypothetical protein